MGVGDSVNINTKGAIGKVLLKPLEVDFSGICVIQCMEIRLANGWNQNRIFECKVADSG